MYLETSHERQSFLSFEDQKEEVSQAEESVCIDRDNVTCKSIDTQKY